MWRIVRILLIMYCTVLVYALVMVNSIMFQPPRAGYSDSPEVIRVRTSDGVRISAVHLRNPEAAHTLLVSHGNAEDIGWMRPFLEELREMGFSVFAYDYRGYGTSEGRPSERGVYRDIDAAYAWLTGEAGLEPGQILLYGRSVGTGAAVDLAARQPVGGLILESPMVSAFRVLTRAPLLPFDRFRNLRKIKRVRCPVLIMHGLHDDIIGSWHGEKLYAAANEPKQFLWVEEAGHNDFSAMAGPRYREAFIRFRELVQENR